MIGSVTELQRALADATAQAQQAISGANALLKTFEERGIVMGPGTGEEPGHPEPSEFGREYVSTGHAAPSPQAMPPRSSPLPTAPHGITPIQLAADVSASQIPAHIVAQFTMGSPSNR